MRRGVHWKWKLEYVLYRGVCETLYYEQIIDDRVQRVYKNLPPSIRMFWLTTTTLHGDKTFIACGGKHYTYRETLGLSLKYAALMKSVYGVKKGANACMFKNIL